MSAYVYVCVCVHVRAFAWVRGFANVCVCEYMCAGACGAWVRGWATVATRRVA